jgi:hypothetical protein
MACDRDFITVHARQKNLCLGIAVLNLAALPVMLAFIAAVTGFRD